MVSSRVIRLKVELHGEVEGDDRLRDPLATQPVLEVLHVINVNSEDVHVIKQAPGGNNIKYPFKWGTLNKNFHTDTVSIHGDVSKLQLKDSGEQTRVN